MSRIRAALDFFMRHRAKVGSVVLALGGVVATWGPKSTPWANLLIAAGGLLAGAGMAPSDAAVKAKQEWEKTGADRRGN